MCPKSIVAHPVFIWSDPVIFGPPDPDPAFFSTDPDPNPTCNNGFIVLFLSWTKHKSESTNSSIKWWVMISNFIPTYLKYKYIFFFITILGRIRSRIRIRIFFFSWAGSGSVERNFGSSSLLLSSGRGNFMSPVKICLRQITPCYR